MSCPTCSHTMSRLDSDTFWCPRCGTVKFANNIQETKLVERCREFEPVLGKYQIPVWRRLGIEESIHTPEERSNP